MHNRPVLSLLFRMYRRQTGARPSRGPQFASVVHGISLCAHHPVPTVTQPGTIQWLNPDAFVSAFDPSTGPCSGGDDPQHCQFREPRPQFAAGWATTGSDRDIMTSCSSSGDARRVFDGASRFALYGLRLALVRHPFGKWFNPRLAPRTFSSRRWGRHNGATDSPNAVVDDGRVRR